MTDIPSFEEIQATTEEQVEAAIREYAEAAKVKTMFKDGTLYAAFNDGTVLAGRFELSLDDFERLSASEAEPMQQFREVLALTGGKDVAADLTKRNAAEATQFMQQWFKTFEQLQNISLGE